jgi:hypothetical protein
MEKVSALQCVWTVARDVYCRFDPKAPVGTEAHPWNTKARKWNGNLHGTWKPPGADADLHFPLHPECETWDELLFGSPNMGNGNEENFTAGVTTPLPPKPKGYTPTVVAILSAGGDGMASDQEEYYAMDFDVLMRAGANEQPHTTWPCVFFADAFAVYGGPAVSTPVKSAAGGSVGVQPPTPPTTQKVVSVKKEDRKSQMEALLSEMKIDIDTVRKAAADKSKSQGGLNMDVIKIIFHHFGIETSGGRTDYNEKLSELLTSLQL